MRYFDTYNKYTARALQGFKQIGTASHVQGTSHSFNTHEEMKQSCYYIQSIEIFGAKDYKTIETINLI